MVEEKTQAERERFETFLKEQGKDIGHFRDLVGEKNLAEFYNALSAFEDFGWVILRTTSEMGDLDCTSTQLANLKRQKDEVYTALGGREILLTYPAEDIITIGKYISTRYDFYADSCASILDC